MSEASFRPSFTAEISQMLYGMGDARKPMPETVALIEDLTRRQLTTLLQRADDLARKRCSKVIGAEDFIFLLRHNPQKLKRLIDYIGILDQRSSINKGNSLEDVAHDDDCEPTAGKRKRQCLEFIRYLDSTNELLDAVESQSMTDEVRMARLLRADLTSRTLDRSQYLQWAEARQASFTPRMRTAKLKEWLLKNTPFESKLGPFMLELLSFFAYETVSQIVDMALIVRKDQEASNYLDRLGPSSTCNNDKDSLLLSSPTNDDVTSPLSTQSPTSVQSVSNYSLGSKKSKRKRSAVNIEDDVGSHGAIQPKHVKEVMRRCLQPTGPFAAFNKRSLKSDWLLCL